MASNYDDNNDLTTEEQGRCDVNSWGGLKIFVTTPYLKNDREDDKPARIMHLACCDIVGYCNNTPWTHLLKATLEWSNVGTCVVLTLKLFTYVFGVV